MSQIAFWESLGLTGRQLFFVFWFFLVAIVIIPLWIYYLKHQRRNFKEGVYHYPPYKSNKAVTTTESKDITHQPKK